MITVLYLLLLILFKYDYSVYVSGSNLLTNNPIWHQIFVNAFRFLMGIFGTVAVYNFLNFCYKHLVQHCIGDKIVSSLEKIGIISLEMYVTQWVVVEIIFAYVMQHVLTNFSEFIVNNSYVCYFFWRNIIGAMMTLITYMGCKFLKTTTLGKYIY